MNMKRPRYPTAIMSLALAVNAALSWQLIARHPGSTFHIVVGLITVTTLGLAVGICYCKNRA